ncbi:MAG: DUF1064 domain-containing protein [Lachnospiraceae bacterium]
MRYRKYNNKKIEVDGMTFDSKKEANRYKELSLLQKAGEISGLQTQVRYVLIPSQREVSEEVYTRGENKGKNKPGKLLERECTYVADFVYYKDGKVIVEDTKGFRTKEYIIKRKLMLYVHHIQIKEI